MRRYLHLLAAQIRTSTLLGLQYRVDFVLDGIIEIFWALTAIVPLFIVFSKRESVAGWSFGESLLVVAWFTLLTGVLEGAIHPSLAAVVEHVRKGTLDFVLLKPADAQFLVSTARFQPWRAVNAVTAMILFVLAFRKIGHGPTPWGIAGALALLAAAMVILYSLGILTVSAAFHVVRVDNLSQLFSSIFDAARWPVAVFRGALRLVFTFVIPLALMTTYPSLALLGRLPWHAFVLSFVVAIVFAAGSRAIWLRAISQYTSAGG
ncbi:ABC-2 family transporter protein [Pendulispora brunnea]|uniref:ABC-2 family transporter protein n=1 Tax=Pendulispora brunnea TaxID=2905690 RepID=A0ABZ2KCF2_9BACT